MRDSPRHAALRWTVRATAPGLPIALVLGSPAMASASPPVTWDVAPPMSRLHALLLFGGVPLALFVLIVFLTVAPSVARGGDQARGVDRWATPQWFNGPRAGEPVEGAPQLPASNPGAVATGDSSATGGADSYAGAGAPAGDRRAPAGAATAGSARDEPATVGASTGRATHTTPEARGRPSSPDTDAGPSRDVVPVAADTGGGASARW